MGVVRGTWETLIWYVGAGWLARMGENVRAVTAVEGGVFWWGEGYTYKLETGKLRFSRGQGLDATTKRRHMVSYLFELGFDLMLDRHKNVSMNPGFETALGIFKQLRHPLLPLPAQEAKAELPTRIVTAPALPPPLLPAAVGPAAAEQAAAAAAAPVQMAVATRVAVRRAATRAAGP